MCVCGGGVLRLAFDILINSPFLINTFPLYNKFFSGLASDKLLLQQLSYQRYFAVNNFIEYKIAQAVKRAGKHSEINGFS